MNGAKQWIRARKTADTRIKLTVEAGESFAINASSEFAVEENKTYKAEQQKVAPSRSLPRYVEERKRGHSE